MVGEDYILPIKYIRCFKYIYIHLLYVNYIRFTNLTIKEMHSVAVQLEGQSLQEGNIIRHHFLVAEVELVYDDGIDVVVGEQVV